MVSSSSSSKRSFSISSISSWGVSSSSSTSSISGLSTYSNTFRKPRARLCKTCNEFLNTLQLSESECTNVCPKSLAGSLFELTNDPYCCYCQAILHLLSPLPRKQRIAWARAQASSHRFVLRFRYHKNSESQSGRLPLDFWVFRIPPGQEVYLELPVGVISTVKLPFKRDLVMLFDNDSRIIKPTDIELLSIRHASKPYFRSIHNSLDFQRLIDTRKLRSILKSCDHDHPECCRHRAGQEFVSCNIRLIDVQENRIVESITTTRYFALSYVWGDANHFLTTKENLLELQRPKSLINIIKALPQTIRDAIVFVHSLGERYLWVDSLCKTTDTNI
jgi:hypothetical protein